ncbi:unnamed protein product [Paramecium sonneborni]|uniref:Uncharacterized protein n=1 Tax=Paramecium sonneborni TaxID=65129 RepID=A0A8S1PVR5_9CILI|nr:unnamed protein product [Paramecium sonneborni]
MKLFIVITLVILATTNETERMKKILDEMPEIKESLIAKKLLAREMELERVLEIKKVSEISDSIQDSIQFIKVAQFTYNSSSTNYTQPNITYNTTYSNYSQPNSSSSYQNQTNSTNATNSTQPNYYNTSYPTQNSINNYVTYDNQSSLNNTNSTSITCQIGYYLTTNLTCLPCQANCAICSSQSICVSCYYGYTLFTNYNTTQNSVSNSYVIDDTYSNSTSAYGTQQNQTYNNYTNQSRIRQRFDQSRVYLKLRNNYYDNNNFTQIISYYNQSNHQQETVVLFNESAVVQRQIQNEYYLYQNNSLVILNREFDPQGNIVYRSINYDFTIVISISEGNSKKLKQNQEIYGTIVYGYGNLNASYNNQQVESGLQSKNYNISNNQSYSNGWMNYNQVNNQGSIKYQNQSNGYSQSDYANAHSDIQYNNSYYYEGNVNFDNNSSNSKSNYSNYQKSLNYNSSYEKIDGIGYSNSTFQEQNSQLNGSSQASNYNGNISSNSQGVSNSYVRNDQSNNIFYPNYALLNQSSNIYNQNSSYNNSENSQNNYSRYDSAEKYQSRNSIITDNYIYSHNVSDLNQHSNVQHQETSQYNGQSEHEFGYNDSTDIQGQLIRDNYYKVNKINTTFDGTINQYNKSNDNYFGDTNSSAFKNVDLKVTDNFSNFAQLRGSKKLATGSWKEVNQKEFENSNGLIVQEVRQAITNKFNPEQEGLQFDSISSIQEQIVAGINYNIKLKYLNANSKSIIYEVVLYTIPWANQPNQLISCSRLDQSEI